MPRPFVAAAALALLLSACQSDNTESTAPLLGERDTKLPIELSIDDLLVDPASDAMVTFERIMPGGDNSEVVHEHSLANERGSFTLDMTGAIGLDISFDGVVVAPLAASFWESMTGGALRIRVSRGGLDLRRRINQPGCIVLDPDRRCPTTTDRRMIPAVFPDEYAVGLPIGIRVAGGVAKRTDATVVSVYAVVGDAAPQLLGEYTIDKTRRIDVVLGPEPSATLRFSIESGQRIDVPAEEWQRAWGNLIVKFLEDRTTARVRVLVGDQLELRTSTELLEAPET